MRKCGFGYVAIGRLRNQVAYSGLAAAMALATFAPAFAQEQAQSIPPGPPTPVTSDAVPPEGGDDEAAIVVTGTLIRGIAPAGSNVIGLGTEQIAASGGTTTNQILGSLPQVGNFFNQLPAGVAPVSGSNTSIPISRPNLRNLPGGNTSGGAQTLVLFDGHRVVGAGISQVAVDPDILAPGVIERVEALTDGGSAVYGSDALGGVLNFITRRKFDGIKVSGRYGFGDEYRSYDGGIMVGKDWGTGGLYVAYGYSHHDAVYGADRDWVKQIDWNTGIATGRNCANPNVTVNGVSYVVSGAGLARGGPNVCDYSDNLAIYPASTLHTAYARLSQDLSDSVRADITAFYANRAIRGQGGTLGIGALSSGATGTATLTASNPSYRNTGDANAGMSQTVLFNYEPLFGARSSTQNTDLESWSVAPQLSVDLGSGWQARGLFSYGNAITSYRNATISAGAQTTALANGTLNPFNVGASGAGSSLRRFAQSIGRNELYDYRLIVDGPLLQLPGGTVRAAAGIEHMHDKFQRRSTDANTFAFLPPANYTQKVDSVFGELQIPVVSQLTVSASARYDKYNDFGDTFNPKVGVTFRPVKWVAIRGNWGKSFNAPSPVDQLGVASSSVAVVPSQFLNADPPGFTRAPGEAGLFVAGTAPGIEPQKATNWSAGAEIKPPFIDGLTLSATYYHISLNGTIGRPITGPALAPFYAGFPQLFLARPSGQQLAAYLTQFNPANFSFSVVNPTSTAQAVILNGGTQSPVLVVLDTRGRNLGATKLSGLDFAANYVMQTGFGSIDAGFAGNYRISQKTKAIPTAPVVNDLASELVRLTFQGTLGATVGGLRGQLIWNHTSGYRRADAGSPAAFGQERVKAFDTINLFFRYQVPETLVGKDLELTLNVQNLLDVAPPLYKSASAAGYDTALGHGLTIGRIIQFGISKRF